MCCDALHVQSDGRSADYYETSNNTMGQDVVQPLPFGYYHKRIYDDSEVYAKFNFLNLHDEFSEHFYDYVPFQYHIHRDDLGRWMVCHIYS